MSLGNLDNLCPKSVLAHLDTPHKLEKLVSEGFKGVNGMLGEMVPELFRSFGLDYSCTVVFDRLHTGLGQIEKAVDLGVSSITVLLGNGFNTDKEVNTWMQAILQRSTIHGVPVLFEIHRGTVTQDCYRTLCLLKRYQGMRITADFSHWYTGLLLENGFDRKIDFLPMVFKRTDCVHGRFSSNSCIQLPISELGEENLRHFKELWLSTLRYSTHKNRSLPFVIELLSHKIGYGQKISVRQESIDDTDRWREALELKKLVIDWCQQPHTKQPS